MLIDFTDTDENQRWIAINDRLVKVRHKYIAAPCSQTPTHSDDQPIDYYKPNCSMHFQPENLGLKTHPPLKNQHSPICFMFFIEKHGLISYPPR